MDVLHVDGETSSRCRTDNFQSKERRILFFVDISIFGELQTDDARTASRGQDRIQRPALYLYYISILVDLLR